MEVLNDAIKRFLTVDYGYGSGSGDGYGYGSGYGSGDGSGSGSGYGYGSGSGDGYGSGSGYGYGSGYGDGLIAFNGRQVNYIDSIPTIIEKVRNNLAKGYIVLKDLTTKPCYVVKHGYLFAHGPTIKAAEQALSDKIFDDMDVDEKIEIFLKEFELEKKYSATLFYDWHHKLTGSCEMGRNAFVKNNGIDLENGEYTVKEFIELTENDYGGSIIKQLKERIEDESV